MGAIEAHEVHSPKATEASASLSTRACSIRSRFRLYKGSSSACWRCGIGAARSTNAAVVPSGNLSRLPESCASEREQRRIA